jgi:lysophospholipase L1-like esterase
MKKILSTIFIMTFIAILITGCQDRSNLTAPTPQSQKSGTADLTRFVTIGNSITAGYQSSSLFKDAQAYSFGNQIAQLVNTPYVQPLMQNPGIGGQLQIHVLFPNLVLVQQPTMGQEAALNIGYAGVYNNLGVPGALVYDVVNATSGTTCAQYLGTHTANPFFDLILRNSVLNIGSQFQQAKALHPTFVTCWIGNNDVLGFATSGGAAPTAPTSAAQFGALYTQLGDSLKSLNTLFGTNVVVANIPDVTTIPYFTTVGPLLAKGTPWTSHGIPGLFYQKHGVTTPDPTVLADSAHLASLQVMITLHGQNYTSLLGQPTGKWYRDNHYPALPPGIDTTKPFGFYPTNPWPDALILDADEIVTAKTATTNFNNSIATVATAKGFGLVDINSVFTNIFVQSVTHGGINYNGINFTAFFITGGLFSLDGVHPSSQGQGLLANEFLKVINSKFGANYPLINLATIPGSLNFGKSIASGKFWFDVYNWDNFSM